jgi:hypothetical protein
VQRQEDSTDIAAATDESAAPRNGSTHEAAPFRVTSQTTRAAQMCGTACKLVNQNSPKKEKLHGDPQRLSKL